MTSRTAESTTLSDRSVTRLRCYPSGDAPHLARRQQVAKIAPGERTAHPSDGLGCALGDHLAAGLPALGTEVDDVVRGLHHVQVVLDDDDGVARIDEAVEHVEQALHVREMEAGRGLVEDVEGPPGRPTRELGRELDPLRLAPRERRRRLTEVDVAEAHVVQRAQLLLARRDVGEERERLLDGHLQNVGDALALVMDLERLAVVPLATADLAWNVDVRHELHLDLDYPLAGTGFAPSTLHVEREAAWRVAAEPGLGHGREELADRREKPRVRRRVRPRRPADRRLVDVDDLVDLLDPLHAVVVPRTLLRAGDDLRETPVEDLVHERALAGARDPGDRDEEPERKAHVDVLQVVLAGAADYDRLGSRLAPPRRHRDPPAAGEIRPGDRTRLAKDVVDRPLGDDLSPVLARARPDVDDPVGRPDRLLVVLDDEDRVAEIAHAQERADEPSVVALMEADRGLIEDVKDAHEP